jgi:hypothetical protein
VRRIQYSQHSLPSARCVCQCVRSRLGGSLIEKGIASSYFEQGTPRFGCVLAGWWWLVAEPDHLLLTSLCSFVLSPATAVGCLPILPSSATRRDRTSRLAGCPTKDRRVMMASIQRPRIFVLCSQAACHLFCRLVLFPPSWIARACLSTCISSHVDFHVV